MRILLLSEHYPSALRPNSGAFVQARVRLYAGQGIQLQVISLPHPELPDQETLEGVPVFRPPDLETGRVIVDRFQPDVIALHFPYRGVLLTRLAAQVNQNYPIVAWIHGYEALYTAFLGYHQGIYRLLSLFHDWLKLRYLGRFLAGCRAVVYVSRWMRQAAEQGMNWQHPHSYVIANPIDTDLFAPATPSPGRQYLEGISLRSLRPIYGLDVAVRAYTGLAETDLTIQGCGPMEQELTHLIKQSGSNTRLVARRIPHTQVPDLLRRYDYFVAPSRNETQGLAMCEAMSCGLPVVATRVGGIPEFVRDGLDGYLVPPEDPAALRTAVQRLVSDPARCRQMGQNARQSMIEICGGRKIAGRELQVLSDTG